MTKKKSNFLEETEIIAALEAFVIAGVLIETTKKGHRAWKENPEFMKKSKTEQEKIFKQLNFSQELLESLQLTSTPH